MLSTREISPIHYNNSSNEKVVISDCNRSAPYLGAAGIGCWCSDPLNRLLGRRGVIFSSAVFCVLAPIGGACAQTWPQLFVTRLLLGIGMGLKASTIPIFCAENTPAIIRGGLVMTWQVRLFSILLFSSPRLLITNADQIDSFGQVGLVSAFFFVFFR